MDAYLLAGGRSQRMGQDKARMLIDGEPMALRLAAKLREAGCREVFIVEKHNKDHSLNLPKIYDYAEEHHPLYGVAAALKHCRQNWALIAACDLICIRPSDIARLLDANRPCVATSEQGIQPLLSVLPTSWAAKAREFAEKNKSARAFVSSCHRILYSASQLHNANSISDIKEQR